MKVYSSIDGGKQKLREEKEKVRRERGREEREKRENFKNKKNDSYSNSKKMIQKLFLNLAFLLFIVTINSLIRNYINLLFLSFIWTLNLH